MIKKFKKIKNMAVFKDFVWDNSLKDKNGKIQEFQTINIIYGRNYSGKTTLSRIVRALETKTISDKYDNPEFEIEFNNAVIIDQEHIKNSVQEIRVFNEDFIKDNLSFLSDTSIDGEIKSFAILGEDNAKLQKEIDTIKNSLGSKKEGEESGLYKDILEKRNLFQKAYEAYCKEQKQLDAELSDKATGNREHAIKYKPELYGDQNYTVKKLKDDIKTVSSDYTSISNETKEELRNTIQENAKDIIRPLTKIEINIIDTEKKTKDLVEQKIGNSQKIESLVRDAELNRWVKVGEKYHKERGLHTCAFCGNPIDATRWEALDKHFDEESEKLENSINDLLNQLSEYEKQINAGLGINKDEFYAKFHTQLDAIENDFNNTVQVKALNAIKHLENQLNKRKNNLFTPLVYSEQIDDFAKDFTDIYERYDKVEKESNDYTTKLKDEQRKAKTQLRLDEVSRFIAEIGYAYKVNTIKSLKQDYEDKQQEQETIEHAIADKEEQIKNKIALMNNEEKGAKKIDEYLEKYFTHHYLSLTAKTEEDDTEKHYRFEILRNGKIAYNLSEGERSLIAFCYFMAKLEDTSTYDKRPIIWIDDPVCSLDSNHVFSIYSLIVAKIANTDSFSQLFVSTHSLNFLSYLKRMNGKPANNGKNKSKAYFCVQRSFEESRISLMPDYLKNHITEFNFLFKEIYTCSKTEVVDNSNFQSFYDFGNNARKFLEIFLFYKYPDDTDERTKMEKFFGKDNVPVIFSERINNEYSHLKENVSRGFSTLDVPEMNSVATLIVNSIEKNDKLQYMALLNSIGAQL